MIEYRGEETTAVNCRLLLHKVMLSSDQVQVSKVNLVPGYVTNVIADSLCILYVGVSNLPDRSLSHPPLPEQLNKDTSASQVNCT